jgi:hypothetical protein
MNIATFVMAMITPMVARILIALGMQVVTITGMAVVTTTLRGYLMSNLAAVPAAGFQLFLLAGGGTALGMILGACATRTLMLSIEKGTKILGANAT